jgi:ubiquinone/menaquinone biosynthesis C-methylase UbiE
VTTAPAGRTFGHEDAAVFETFVVPRYLSLFGDGLVNMLAESDEARVCHVQCRTGYPDRALLERLPNAHVFGCDASPSAVELARAKAAALVKGDSNVVFDYLVADTLPLAFPDAAFSHVFAIHPLATPRQRKLLLDEMARIVAPHGQVLIALPLRGSFSEIADLLRECALKHELVELTNAIDAGLQARPTQEVLEQELEAAGFEYVEIETQTHLLPFAGGRQFFEDPATRLLVLPELRVNIALDTPSLRAQDPLEYVRNAIDKYWSDGSFQLTVNVGVASGRRKGPVSTEEPSAP